MYFQIVPNNDEKNQVPYSGMSIYCRNNGTGSWKFPILASNKYNLYIGTYLHVAQNNGIDQGSFLQWRKHPQPYNVIFLSCPDNDTHLEILPTMVGSKSAYISTYPYIPDME